MFISTFPVLSTELGMEGMWLSIGYIVEIQWEGQSPSRQGW